jgi:hypothetical protein
MSRCSIPKPRVVLTSDHGKFVLGHCYFCGKDFPFFEFVDETCPKCKVKAKIIERK